MNEGRSESMPKIDLISLRSRDPEAQRGFYGDVLGMQDTGHGTMGYGGAEARLAFPQANGAYRPGKTDLYWKIALAVPDLDLAREQLLARDVDVGPARQFLDVGYLAHLTDPEGFTIELIQHWFDGNRPAAPVDSSRLGGGASLNLLTLRAAEISEIQALCQRLGMTPLSIQPIDDYGFTLYFFAFTEDRPPNSDLHAVDNREWLYQRPYTVLEIQHLHDATDIAPTSGEQAGYAGVAFSGLQIEEPEAGRLIGAR